MHAKPSRMPPGNKDVRESKSPDSRGSLFSMRAFGADRDLPIVYCEKYDIYMIGLELIHQFDTKKYKKMADILNTDFLDTPFARFRNQDDEHKLDGQDEKPPRRRRLHYMKPNRPVNVHELEIHHTQDYIQDVHEDKSLVARITETWALNLMPQATLESRLLTPLKWQVAGSIYAFHLAMQHGWAINLGGGFHQASASNGDTFCVFSDIMLSMKYVWRKHPLQKFMIVDLDAHQATGLERDIVELDSKRRKMVFMLDVFNNSIQPPDPRADAGIDLRVELVRFTGNHTYVRKLEKALEGAFAKFKPTMVVYVAGQDVLKDDQLGLMNLSDDALMKRDELVFSWATERQRCPIVMLLGGGYLTRGAKVQADSIRNLFTKNLIWGGHKSGSRSLSRPRRQKGNSDMAANLGSCQQQAPSSERSAESAANNVSKATKSPAPRKQAQIIRVAPISKRLIKKSPERSSSQRSHGNHHEHLQQGSPQQQQQRNQPPPPPH